MKIIDGISHLDHGLNEAALAWISGRFQDRIGFFIETFTLPEVFGTVPCGLHGPIVGDPPVPDGETVLEVRGTRAGPSRLCERAPRMTRTITVIAGPTDDDACVLYTAFGGPCAPREPWDQSLNPTQKAESEAFWKEHALSR